jgi:hypothetical protein
MVKWIKFFTAVQLNQVVKHNHNINKFFKAAEKEANTNKVWARYAPLTPKGSLNLQVDIESATVTGTTVKAVDDVSTSVTG